MKTCKRPSVIIYTSTSQMRHPVQLLGAMWADLFASRELAWQLLQRDISAQYRQSLLGVAWAFLPPIFAAIGFSLAANSKVLNVGPTELPYAAYVMFSTVLWQTFVEALMMPIQNITAARQMLTRINFPREAMILSGIGQVFFNFCFKLILVVGMFLWFKMPVTLNVLIAPVGLVHLVMLGTLFGILIAPFSILYQDFSRGLPLLTGLWLLLTPVVYPIPKGSGLFSIIVQLNPVTPLLVTTRELATTGVISNPMGFWIVSAAVVIGLFCAWVIYRLSIPFVIERISA
jgi:lipopolysaccharide transport system permease protein